MCEYHIKKEFELQGLTKLAENVQEAGTDAQA